MFPPWFPSDPSDRLHLLMFTLHALGAIGAFIMSMYCDVLHANQRAMIPHSIAPNDRSTTLMVTSNVSEALLFRAGFPWSQDAEFKSHVWNPYLLVVVFEWLTAGFALCTPRIWRSKAKEWVNIWLALGVTAVLVWFLRHYVLRKTPNSSFPTAMLILLVPSFAGAALVCLMYLTRINMLDPVPEHGEDTSMPGDQEHASQNVPLIPPANDPTDNNTHDGQAGSMTRRVIVQGRQW